MVFLASLPTFYANKERMLLCCQRTSSESLTTITTSILPQIPLLRQDKFSRERKISGRQSMMSLAVMLTCENRRAAASPAAPWIQVASRAASNVSSPCPMSAAKIPLSTSPEPAVAMPGLPVGLCHDRSPWVTSVLDPFRSTVIFAQRATVSAAVSSDFRSLC